MITLLLLLVWVGVTVGAILGTLRWVRRHPAKRVLVARVCAGLALAIGLVLVVGFHDIVGLSCIALGLIPLYVVSQPAKRQR